jgi:23S rRNA (guanosine2251-2'-O)-methyltransferase
MQSTIKKLSMSELNRKSVDEFKRSEKTPVIVVLENIRSMHNVGSVFRTADAFLIEAVYICGYTAKPPRKEIDKTALGATETVHWKYFSTTKEAIEELKTNGFTLFAIEQVDKSISLEKISEISAEKIALIFGNEVSGVEEETILTCEGCIEIPQFGMKHSLNISVAAGIVLWEVVRNKLSELLSEPCLPTGRHDL